MAIQILDLTREDWPGVRQVYSAGLATGDASFETKIPDWEAWDQSHLPDPRLVAKKGRKILAWAALSPVSKRQVYAGVAEVSIYVAEGSRGMGIGKLLLTRLIERSEAAGIWTLQASIFPENSASLNLHRRCGFRQVGIREHIARREGRWRDVILLERRSEVAGR